MGARPRVCGVEGAAWVENNAEAGSLTAVGVNETPPPAAFYLIRKLEPKA